MNSQRKISSAKRFGFLVFVVSSLVGSYVSGVSAAIAAAPPCMDKGKVLPINNTDVIYWKRSTKNQWASRAHVEGTVIQAYPDKNGHEHFQIALDPTPGDTLEIIYNISFGALPEIKPGMKIEACGDYITSTAQAGAYPPSPDGAILHWVHYSPKPTAHDHGYVQLDDKVYGAETPRAAR